MNFELRKSEVACCSVEAQATAHQAYPLAVATFALLFRMLSISTLFSLMTRYLVQILVLAVLTACSGSMKAWSPVTKSTDGTYKVIGTVGLSLSLGLSGKVQFTLGPEGSQFAPESAEAVQDASLFGLAVGQWTLEKGSTKVMLPRGSDGYVQVRNLYENFAPEVWRVLSSPGCSTLSAFTQSHEASGGAVVQRTYRLCDVDKAVQDLRR